MDKQDSEDIIKIVAGIFFVLCGAGLVFTGIGIIGSFICWWVAYKLFTDGRI